MTVVNGLQGSTGTGSTGRVQQAIALASRRTGVDFSYLLGQAQIESSMNPNARARTSSATGLYQFLDQSWLAVINDHGADYGMSWAADAISRTASGRYQVDDPQLRQQILDLRNHPETASVMAAELASDNRAYLEQRIGRPAESVDLYLAHFLGAAGAAKFLTTLNSAPNASGAALFPAAARANSGIFYDRQGNARSLADIRGLFAAKLSNGVQMAGQSSGTAGANHVQPADYLRIARQQQRAAIDTDGERADPLAGTDSLSGQDQLAMQRLLAGGGAYPELAPRPETARLAYLMLATYGR